MVDEVRRLLVAVGEHAGEDSSSYGSSQSVPVPVTPFAKPRPNSLPALSPTAATKAVRRIRHHIRPASCKVTASQDYSELPR